MVIFPKYDYFYIETSIVVNVWFCFRSLDIMVIKKMFS